MFTKKLKLEKEHEMLIKAISEKMQCSFTDAGYCMLEKGFVFMRLLSEDNKDKINEALDLYKSDKLTADLVKTMREWWDAGQDKANKINC
jgi:hypothetical protein